MVTLDAEQCYRALRAKDPRFDGLFFVAVESTGVYCRPICPARTPARARCRFYVHAAAAERAGFRACLRCRPELAPGTADVDALPRLVRDASERIADGYLDDHGVEQLAAELGVTARHLRRATETALGVSPLELAHTRRLAIAKQLLQDTELPIAQVAFAAGFSSVRRFNASVRERFGVAPSRLRGRVPARAGLQLRLDYRPPFEWAAMLAFLRARALPGVEQVGDDHYRRLVVSREQLGWVEVRADARRPRLLVELSIELAASALAITRRLRRLFDLDAEPLRIAEQLGEDPRLAASVVARPGLRVPGAFDRFETAVRIVLGQQVSVAAATTLAGRLVERFGGGRMFPTAAQLAALPLSELEAIGLPGRRAQAVAALARAVVDERLRLAGSREPSEVMAVLEQLPGVGPWTAQMIAMRSLRWPDALPAGDLVLQRALGCSDARACARAAEAWRPWRAYAVIHLWSASS